MSLDPYPDHPFATGFDTGTGHAAPAEAVDLDEAESRLLRVLTSQPSTPVVVAVEDQPRVARTAQDGGGRGGALAPVFQEPAG